jgi:hypothetical protein
MVRNCPGKVAKLPVNAILNRNFERSNYLFLPMKNVIKGLAIAGLLVTLAVPAFAQVPGNPCPNPPVPGVPCSANVNTANPNTVYNILSSIINIAFIILMLLAVLFIIWAAFKYLTAGGDPENVETAQRMLLYAVIAIVIGLLAKSVPLIVGNFVNSNVTQ